MWGQAVWTLLSHPDLLQEGDVFFPFPLRFWEGKGSHSRKQSLCAMGPLGMSECGGFLSEDSGGDSGCCMQQGLRV